MIRVLVVDDSDVSRDHIRHILETESGITVVGMAENGEQALRSVEELKPDLITMDVKMPGMSGFEVTRRIMETTPVPIIIVSASVNPKDVEQSFEAMEAGAVAIAEKPFGEGHPRHREAAKELLQAVRLMAEVKVIKRWPKARIQESGLQPSPEFMPEDMPRKVQLVVIGASTGGPPVLQIIFSGLKPGFPFPVMVVQHIASGFIEGMVEWLRHTTGHHIHIAMNGENIQPGHIYFAPDDFHMGIRKGRVALVKANPENGIRPSVSYLFRSAAETFRDNVAGVLLTGMGRDGAEEMRALKDLGAVTIVQDRNSSVVYGMPGEALKLDGATMVLQPEKIPAMLEKLAFRPS